MDFSNKNMIASTSWGIPGFDEVTRGLPANDLSIIETPDFRSASIVLGHYIYAGLKAGERCALISFDTAVVFLEKFLSWNINFEQYIDSEQLLLLKYQPNVIFEIGLTNSYGPLFSEIHHFSKGAPVTRIACAQIDTLISMNNSVLMNSSVQKLKIAASEYHGGLATILGQFVQFNDQNHRNLGTAFQKIAAGYFSLKEIDANRPDHYLYQTKKLPWFGYLRQGIELDLKEGEGFVHTSCQLHKAS